MFITAQTFILNIVMMVLDLMERGGHALWGVIAYGSPGGFCSLTSRKLPLPPHFIESR